MANKPLNTAILDRAIIFAVRALTGSERRGKGFPYIVHPMEAVEIVDQCLSELVEAAKAKGYEVVITADHGNADHAINDDGTPNTAHSTNPVPFIYVTENSNARVQNGVLADVAPTILHIMGLQQPQEMTGQCLISQSCKNLNILRISGKSPF